MTHDLLTKCFKAYKAYSGNKIFKFVAVKQSDWEDDKDMTPNCLMEKSSNKYKTMKTKEIWEAPSAE